MNEKSANTVVTFVSVFALVGIAASIGVGVNVSSNRVPDMVCKFDRIPGSFLVKGRELKKTGPLVLASRNGRTHAFLRDQILACEVNDGVNPVSDVVSEPDWLLADDGRHITD